MEFWLFLAFFFGKTKPLPEIYEEVDMTISTPNRIKLFLALALSESPISHV